MGYYCIRLRNNVRNICTIFLPWGKYQYNILPMGLVTLLIFFRKKKNEILQEFECIYILIDNPLFLMECYCKKK